MNDKTFDLAMRAIIGPQGVAFVEGLIAEKDAVTRRAIQAEAALNNLRPVWAQGYTSDSIAAQSSANALGQLWRMLEVDNQVSALRKLAQLIDDANG